MFSGGVSEKFIFRHDLFYLVQLPCLRRHRCNLLHPTSGSQSTVLALLTYKGATWAVKVVFRVAHSGGLQIGHTKAFANPLQAEFLLV